MGVWAGKGKRRRPQVSEKEGKAGAGPEGARQLLGGDSGGDLGGGGAGGELRPLFTCVSCVPPAHLSVKRGTPPVLGGRGATRTRRVPAWRGGCGRGFCVRILLCLRRSGFSAPSRSLQRENTGAARRPGRRGSGAQGTGCRRERGGRRAGSREGRSAGGLSPCASSGRRGRRHAV